MPERLRQPHLAALLHDLDRTRADAEALRDRLTDDQLTWKPDATTWSVAECFEHLRRTDKAYVRGIGRVLETAQPADEPPTYRATLLGALYQRTMKPGGWIKLPAPASIRPGPVAAAAGAEAVERFLEQQAALRELLLHADEYDPNAIRMSSPIASWVRISLGDALTVLVMHEQRHALQARRLTERPDFPQM